MKLKVVEREPDTEIIELIEDILDMARRGEINDICIVAGVADSDGPSYFRAMTFSDRLRILGALEYAKDGVHQG